MNRLEQVVDDIYSRGFAIIEDFLPLDDYQDLSNTAQAMHSNGLFRSAKIGPQLLAGENSDIRSDKIAWLDDASRQKAIVSYFTKIRQLALVLNQSLFLGLEHFEAHFAVYPPGSFYRKHVDQFKSNQDRLISCVYYLNHHWQPGYGGQLKLYEDNHPVLEIFPDGNRFICFKSSLIHEVCETKQTRYSIAGWMKIRSLSLIA